MKCKTKGCELEASALSWHDEPEMYDIKTRLPIEWQRTVHWRCLNGHQHTTTKMVSATEQLPAAPAKPKHIKGPAVRRDLPQPPQPILTNHQRHLMRQAQRQQAEEAERNAKAAAQKV